MSDCQNETYSNDGVICPYCGHEYNEAEGLDWEETEDEECSCESCGKDFLTQPDVSYTRISWKPEFERE